MALKMIKRLGRRAFQSLGYDLKRFRKNPPGVNPFHDMQRLLGQSRQPASRPIIADVGAHEGESVRTFRRWIPDCEIHSFEPAPATYATLVQNVGHIARVFPNNLAVGNSCDPHDLIENSESDMSSLLPPGPDCWGEVIAQTTVEMIPLEQYCRSRGIGHINILKTDTQGFELEVLRGCDALLENNRIQMVFAEINFSQMYEQMPTFDKIFSFLIARNFRLVSIYNIHMQHGFAGWCDALFLNSQYKPPNDSPQKK